MRRITELICFCVFWLVACSDREAFNDNFETAYSPLNDVETRVMTPKGGTISFFERNIGTSLFSDLTASDFKNPLVIFTYPPNAVNKNTNITVSKIEYDFGKYYYQLSTQSESLLKEVEVSFRMDDPFSQNSDKESLVLEERFNVISIDTSRLDDIISFIESDYDNNFVPAWEYPGAAEWPTVVERPTSESPYVYAKLSTDDISKGWILDFYPIQRNDSIHVNLMGYINNESRTLQIPSSYFEYCCFTSDEVNNIFDYCQPLLQYDPDLLDGVRESRYFFSMGTICETVYGIPVNNNGYSFSIIMQLVNGPGTYQSFDLLLEHNASNDDFEKSFSKTENTELKILKFGNIGEQIEGTITGDLISDSNEIIPVEVYFSMTRVW